MKDRRLILERFYRDRKFVEIAAATGESEGACKKRLKRALDKLSGILTARGVTRSATALASVLGAELARAAPSKAAAITAQNSLAAASSVSTATLLTNSLLTMSSTKTTTFTTAAIIALAAVPFFRLQAEARRMKTEIDAGATGKSIADAQHAAVAIEHACTWAALRSLDTGVWSTKRSLESEFAGFRTARFDSFGHDISALMLFRLPGATGSI